MKKDLFLVLCVFLIGCESQNFYLKAVKSNDYAIKTNLQVAVIPENWDWSVFRISFIGH